MILQSLIITIASLSVFLIFTEILTIDIFHGEKTVIDFNLMIFGIRFTQTKNKKKKGRKKRFRSAFYTLKNIVEPIIRKSELSINSIRVFYPHATPFINAIKVGIFNSAISSALAYVEANSKKFRLGTITYEDSANNNYRIVFDISLKLSLLSFFFAVVKAGLHKKRKVNELWQKTK